MSLRVILSRTWRFRSWPAGRRRAKPWDTTNTVRVHSTAHAVQAGGAKEGGGFYFSLSRAPIGPFKSNVVVVEYMDGKEGNWFSVDAKTTGAFRKIEPAKGRGFLRERPSRRAGEGDQVTGR